VPFCVETVLAGDAQTREVAWTRNKGRYPDMSTFEIPFVAVNPSSWGPPSAGGNPNAPAHKFADLPYAPFGRSDRLGRAADLRGRRRPEEDFQLVDTAKAVQPKRFVNPASKRRQHTQRLRQINARRQGTGGNAVLQAHSLSGRGGGRGGRGGPAGGRGGGGRGGRGGRGYDRHQRVDRAPSVAVQDDWVAMEEVDLGKITKNIVMGDVPEAQDVIWCGFLDPYNEAYDKVSIETRCVFVWQPSNRVLPNRSPPVKQFPSKRTQRSSFTLCQPPTIPFSRSLPSMVWEMSSLRMLSCRIS